MIHPIYAIRDIKTGFLMPNVDINDASAIRNFEHAVLNNRDSLFFSHPEDYVLFCIGEYDTETGVLSPYVPINEVISAAAIMRKVKEVNPDGR